MNKSFIKNIKQKLLQLKETISVKQLELLDIDNSGDEVDQIQAKILANIQTQLSSRDKTKLKAIDIVLNKIDEGSFGHCDECGEEISAKRLLINPLFTKCIGCAEELEALERKNRRV